MIMCEHMNNDRCSMHNTYIMHCMRETEFTVSMSQKNKGIVT